MTNELDKQILPESETEHVILPITVPPVHTQAETVRITCGKTSVKLKRYGDGFELVGTNASGILKANTLLKNFSEETTYDQALVHATQYVHKEERKRLVIEHAAQYFERENKSS